MVTLNREKEEGGEYILSKVESDIVAYIENNTTEDYDKVLALDDRWDVFYHLSMMRMSLLNWYDFIPDSDLLEIGGGFGALTGLFCDRCAHVTTIEKVLPKAAAICRRYEQRNNLEVYAGEFGDIQFTKKFNYIVLVDILGCQGDKVHSQESYAKYLAEIYQLLKPNGVVLLAVENRYGIKYFCGAQDSVSGKPFDGINKYPQGTELYSFSRQELIEIIRQAGYDRFKFYYPMPDYKLPQVIYSERYLPESGVRDRVIPYYQNTDTLIALEENLYEDVIQNNVFEFFSNSFLLECSLNGEFCSVNYSAVSTDRGKKHAFATSIRENNIVTKTALFQEGMNNLDKVYDHILDIQNHGLEVVSHEKRNMSLVMPYVKTETAIDYMKRIISKNSEKFHMMIHQLYNCIILSSERAESDENALMTEDTQGLDWGIILKKAYIDMIPLNSFYDGENFIFFDQEFARDNYPAKYTLFRAIRYTYLNIPVAEELIPLDNLKTEYGLKKLWDIFMQEEDRFIWENRQHETYHQFYSWAGIDKQKVYANTRKLLTSSSIKQAENYGIVQNAMFNADRLQKIQKVEFQLLKALVDVCEKNNLQYYAIYGTLLGAVRHAGFIPWDDDIDIAMPRDDYNQLILIANQEFPSSYFLQTPQNDENCFYGGYAKLRSNRSTGIELLNWEHNCNSGIWIDIFPLDNFDEDNQRREMQLDKVQSIQRMLFAKTYGDDVQEFRDISAEQWKSYISLARCFSREWLCGELEKAITESNAFPSNAVAILARYHAHQDAYKFYAKDLFFTVRMIFEGLSITVPRGYEECLATEFGGNYMQYLPMEQRMPHHQAFYEPETPYLLYQKRFWSAFDEIAQKAVVIFGAGIMLDDYMEKHGKHYPPVFLVDNDKSKWGTMVQGFMVKSPESVRSIPPEKLHLIICNIYYRQIEKQLKDMGIENYYIYVEEREWLTGDPQ